MATSEHKVHTKVREEKCSLEWIIDSFSKFGGNTLKSPSFSAVGGTVSWTMIVRHNALPDKCSIKVSLESKANNVTDGFTQPLQFSYMFRLISSTGTLITMSGDDVKKYHFDEYQLFQKHVFLTELAIKIEADVSVHIGITSTPSSLQNLSHQISGTATALFETRKFSDFILSVQETDIRVHKCVLALKSSVFEAKLLQDSSEAQLNVMELKDMELMTVESMVEFFYMNTVSKFNVALALDLLRAAAEYNVVDLTKYCSSYLRGKICLSNVIDILMVASTLSVPELKEACGKYISKNRPLKLDDKHKEKMELIKDVLLEYFCEV